MTSPLPVRTILLIPAVFTLVAQRPNLDTFGIW